MKKRSFGICATVSLVSAIVGSNCNFAAAQSDAKTSVQLIEEAVQKWSEITDRFVSNGLSYTSINSKKEHSGIIDDEPKGQVQHEAITWELRASNGMFVEAGAPRPEDNVDSTNVARCINGSYCFTLGRRVNDGDWFIETLLDGKEMEESLINKMAMDYYSRVYEAIYFTAGWPCTLKEIFTSSHCEILDTKSVVGPDSSQLFEVTFTLHDAPEQQFPPIQTGIIRFDPANDWLPLSWEFTFEGGGVSKGHNSEFQKSMGILIPLKQSWQTIKNGDQVLREIVIEKKNFQLGNVSKYEFALSAFGLPEVSNDFKRPFPYFMVGLVCLSVVLLIGGFWTTRNRLANRSVRK